jgi:hypothetical protein
LPRIRIGGYVRLPGGERNIGLGIDAFAENAAAGIVHDVVVRVDETWVHDATDGIDAARRSVTLRHLGIGADVNNRVARDRDCASVKDAPLSIQRHDDSVANRQIARGRRGICWHRIDLPGTTLAGRQVVSRKTS